MVVILDHELPLSGKGFPELFHSYLYSFTLNFEGVTLRKRKKHTLILKTLHFQ